MGPRLENTHLSDFHLKDSTITTVTYHTKLTRGIKKSNDAKSRRNHCLTDDPQKAAPNAGPDLDLQRKALPRALNIKTEHFYL